MKEQIIRLEVERVRALIEKDFPALEHIMSNDCIHIESSGTLRTMAQFMAAFRAGEFSFETFVIDENDVRFYGETAVVVGRYHNIIVAKGIKQPLKRARHTRVYVKRDGAWKMVSHQATELK